MRAVDLRFLQRGKCSGNGPALYATMRNESYFLPHFLAHYRRMGITEFWFLDDDSSDATLDILAGEPDVTVLRANYRFGEQCGRLRFGIVSRTLIPRRFLSQRWVVNVDLDEFLLLPEPFDRLPGLLEGLERHGLRTCRGVMIDFFPRALEELDAASWDKGPFELCPYFDVQTEMEWPDHASAPVVKQFPRDVDHHPQLGPGGVRQRLYGHLSRESIEAKGMMKNYVHPNVNKVPIVRWSDDAEMLSAHRSNLPVRDLVQVVLAHFKFYPHYQQKIRDALATGAYWNGSIEYRMLDLASRSLSGTDLLALGNPTFSRQTRDLARVGLLYSKMGSA